MKKVWAILLTLALALGLAACGGRDGAGDPDNEPAGVQDPAENGGPAPEGQEPQLPSAGDEREPQAPDQSADPAQPQPDEPKEDGEKPEEETVHVSHRDVTLRYAGESFRLTVWDTDGKDPDACSYTSADEAVAAVDAGGGEITAVAPGTTTVTVHAVFGDKEQDFDCIVRCVWREEAAEEPGQPVSGGAADPSLADFFATLQSSYEGLGAMAVMEGEVLDAYYPGLSDVAAVEEVLIQETMMSMSNVAVGLVKFSDEATLDDRLAVQAIFQARITAQAEGGAWYPASCETWEQGIITSVSNVAGMFVYPDEAQSMADLFTVTYSN